MFSGLDYVYDPSDRGMQAKKAIDECFPRGLSLTSDTHEVDWAVYIE